MTRYYIHPQSWNAHVLPNLKASGKRLCDGFYAVGAPGYAVEALGPTQDMVAQMLLMGYEVIPGLQLFSGCPVQNMSSWYQTSVWQQAAKWVETFKGKNFAIDGEATWDREPRYAGLEAVHLLSIAMQPLIYACRSLGVHLHLIPGPVYGFVAALAWALGGDKITVCDEGTYNWGTDTARVASQVGYGLAVLRSRYLPGVKLSCLPAFRKSGFGDCWVYADGTEMQELGK